MRKNDRRRERESREAGKWVTGIQCKLVAGDDDGDVRGGNPSGVEDKKLNVTLGFLAWVTGWVVSSINHHALMAAPNALLLGDLNHGWLRVARHLRGPHY